MCWTGTRPCLKHILTAVPGFDGLDVRVEATCCVGCVFSEVLRFPLVDFSIKVVMDTSQSVSLNAKHD